MREIKVTPDTITLTDKIEIVYEKEITPLGTSGKIGAPRKYIGRRAYVIILKD